jgi:lipopolysaccharide assembly outer membrane protein LptD (OstA)
MPSTFNHVDVGGAPAVRANFTMEPWEASPSPAPAAPSAQPASRPDRDVMISADSQTTQGDFILYRGNVRMTTSGMVLFADELDFNTVTRSAGARGRVTMRVIPAAPR